MRGEPRTADAAGPESDAGPARGVRPAIALRLGRSSAGGRTVVEHVLAALVLPFVLVAALEPSQPWATATYAGLGLVWFGIAIGLLLRASSGQARSRHPAEWAPEAAALVLVGALLAAGASPVWALVLAIPLHLVRLRWILPSVRTAAGRWHAALLAAGAVVASGSAFAAVEERGWGDGLWWSICTMTTVGSGDIAPETTAGRLIGVVTMLIGIGLLTALIGGVARGLLLDGESADRTPGLAGRQGGEARTRRGRVAPWSLRLPGGNLWSCTRRTPRPSRSTSTSSTSRAAFRPGSRWTSTAARVPSAGRAGGAG
jgi:hypothetical protein